MAPEGNRSESSRETGAGTLQGADPEIVRRAVERRDPFPGTAGFAGMLTDRPTDGRRSDDARDSPAGRLSVGERTLVDERGQDDERSADDERDRRDESRTLVRDVLGRYPLFVDGDEWAFSPATLDDPRSFPAGSIQTSEGRERVWTLPNPPPEADEHSAIEEIRAAIETARRAVPDTSIGVAFSGGIDSALVAAIVDGPLYTVGFPGSHDVDAAAHAAEAMGRDDHTVVTLDHDDLERAVPIVARATGRTDAMDVQIALALYLVAERAAADGLEFLALGQGADELFGGYEKVARVDHRVEADTTRAAVREVIETLPEQLERDVLAVRAAGVEPVAPLLHDAVVAAALGLPEELLVDGEGTRKVALRTVASEYVPASIANREKKAFQYGSLVARELDRLARRAGFKRRLDDHITQYVESLLQ